MTYIRIPEELEFGKKRRDFIKQAFLKDPDSAKLYVNGLHQIQIKNDPDLKKLVKSGFLKMVKERDHGWSGRPFHRTFLVLV